MCGRERGYKRIFRMCGSERSYGEIRGREQHLSGGIPHTPGAIRMVIKQKGLRKKEFVRP